MKGVDDGADGLNDEAFDRALSSTKRKTAKVQVVSVTQSPLNPKQWLLMMADGHDFWVTASRRPSCGMRKCEKCTAVAL